jgi:peptidoglycan/LPS O-acetylase OafA/YrhL
MNRFVALDSWRGIAACLVAVYQLEAFSHVWGVPFVRNSWLFVDFFFVLSGFVIAANYEQRLLEGFGVGRFLLLRLGRLYPLHLAMLALFIAFEALKALARQMPAIASSTNAIAPFSTPQEAPATILANLLLVHGLHLFDFLTWNASSWSISVVFTTYALFAACLIALRRQVWLAAALPLLAGPVLIAVLSEHNLATTYDCGLIRCTYGFAAGAVSWNVYNRWGGALAKWLSGSVAEWGAIALVVVFVTAAETTLLTLAAPYVFAIVVLVFASDGGTASAILRRRPLVFLGTISYSICMTQLFVLRRLFDAASALDKLSHVHLFTHVDVDGVDTYFLGTQRWHGDIAYLVFLALVIAMSTITYRLIEKPGRDWVRKRVSRRASRIPATKPAPEGTRSEAL